MYEGHDLKMTKEKGSSELAWNPWTNDFDRMNAAQRKEWDHAYAAKNDAFHTANLSGRELAEWKGQRYLQEYLATIASLDEGVGKILDYIRQMEWRKHHLSFTLPTKVFIWVKRGGLINGICMKNHWQCLF